VFSVSISNVLRMLRAIIVNVKFFVVVVLSDIHLYFHVSCMFQHILESHGQGVMIATMMRKFCSIFFPWFSS
jgi:hypothetical protein